MEPALCDDQTIDTIRRLKDETVALTGHLNLASRRAVADFQNAGNALVTGGNVRLCQQLTQRWLGPVGGLVALWARILVCGSGIAHLLRFGNPISQIAGAVSAVKTYGTSKNALADAERSTGAALYRYDSTIVSSWPDIAELLSAPASRPP